MNTDEHGFFYDREDAKDTKAEKNLKPETVNLNGFEPQMNANEHKLFMVQKFNNLKPNNLKLKTVPTLRGVYGR